MDMKTVVRIVDDYIDSDPNTKDSCPGTVYGHKLIPIGRQIERRWLRKSKIKHLIFQEESTRNIWYKQSFCNAGVVAMGFSLSLLAQHPNAVPMEVYAEAFLDKNHLIIPLGMNSSEWLKLNDFELV